MAQPTAQKLETTYCRKIDDGNPNNSANTNIYAYSETTFSVPTIVYGMTENRTVLKFYFGNLQAEFVHYKNSKEYNFNKNVLCN